LSESPATQLDRVAKHEIEVTRMVELQKQAFGRVAVKCSENLLMVGGAGGGRAAELSGWVEGQAKPIEEGVRQEVLRVDWLDGGWMYARVLAALLVKEIRG
jgi:hypothetical protein